MERDCSRFAALIRQADDLENSADLGDLFAELYDQLYLQAARLMKHERKDHTLQPTALLHEAYLRIANSDVSFRDQNHFVATASIVLRRVLVNHARSRNAKKRRGEEVHVSIFDVAERFEDACIDILALDDALKKLATLDPTQHRLVELRFFGGMTNRDAANVLGISERTAFSEWAHAKAWLKCELGDEG